MLFFAIASICNYCAAMVDALQFSRILSRPMSKKTSTELHILISSYESQASAENAAKLISTLREALDASEKDRRRLEKDIRKLEIFLSENACAQRKGV
jgi:hypothetical protein